MENPIKLVHKFNKEAGLLDKPYNDFLESSFLVEEAIEGFNLDNLVNALNLDVYSCKSKDVARAILSSVKDDKMSDVERFDKHIDAFVYTVGGMLKLGLTPQQIEQGIAIVMAANMKKLGAPKDAEGKQMKPENWEQYAPEAKLQAILDKRQL